MAPIYDRAVADDSSVSAGSPEALVPLEKRVTPTILQISCNELRIAEVSS